jgi:hypothetical protein
LKKKMLQAKQSWKAYIVSCVVIPL